ncbi:MAG: hypothetical protein ABW321_07330 [Polyangiales bacterium]
MTIQSLDKAQLKLILKTSQDFPAQWPNAQARVVNPGLPTRRLSPSRAGHAIGSHLRGAGATKPKTKFCSLDDMADALALVLQTSPGVQALQTLAAGERQTVEVQVAKQFEIYAEWGPPYPLRRVFSRVELTMAHVHATRCVAVLEGRLRNGTLHLHVQTFYPALSPIEVARLFDNATKP